jgi:hypothetical protein
MKGGKGGVGRKHGARPATKPKEPHSGPKRGVPKKDWGAVPNDDGPGRPAAPPPGKRRPNAP